jgi:hypothetical protein
MNDHHCHPCHCSAVTVIKLGSCSDPHSVSRASSSILSCVSHAGNAVVVTHAQLVSSITRLTSTFLISCLVTHTRLLSPRSLLILRVVIFGAFVIHASLRSSFLSAFVIHFHCQLWSSHRCSGVVGHPYSAVTVTHTQLWPSPILIYSAVTVTHTQLWPSPILTVTQLRPSSIFSHGHSNRDKFSARGAPRGLQRDVVNLGWPIAPSYMSPNAGGGGGAAMSTAVHRGTGAQINFRDLIPFWTFGCAFQGLF